MLAAVWTMAALHTGLSMRRSGRRWWVWLLISLVLTVIPAVVMSYVDYFRQRRGEREGGISECRHCGELMVPRNLRRVAGQTICAACGMVIEQDVIA